MQTKGAKMTAEEAHAFASELDFHHDGQINYEQAITYLLECLAHE
jgi:Ca2+-binding EF-hand superfamily protein